MSFKFQVPNSKLDSPFYLELETWNFKLNREWNS